MHTPRTLRACTAGVVLCGALALTGTAIAKMPCPMGDMASDAGTSTAAGPSGSARTGSTAPLVAPGGVAPASPAQTARPEARQPAQQAATTAGASAPASVSVSAVATASVPVSTTVPATAYQPVASTAPDPRAQAAAQAAERVAARRAAAQRAAAKAKVTLHARLAGHERWQAPGSGSASVEPAVTARARPGGASGLMTAGLGLLVLLAIGGLARTVTRHARRPADAAESPLEALRACGIEAELQEIIAEERARELATPDGGGSR